MFSDLNSEFFSWIRGGLLLLFLINFGLYFQNKKRLFLNYSLYLLFVFIFFLEPVVPVGYKLFYDFFGYSFFFFSFFFYTEFERVLLSSKYTVPLWDRYLVVKKYTVLVVSISFPLVYYFLGPEVFFLEVFVFSSALSIFVIRTYFVIYKIKERNVGFFIFGSSSFLLLGNIGSFFKVINRSDLDALAFDPLVFVYIGVMFEAMVFTNIMGNIFKQILEKKANLKVQYALKQKETAELKMTALQSQMNPHFLFNSLNSINNFVLKNEKEEASEYITSFSKLVRLTLKNSENLQISLHEELVVLETYIGLERTRLSGGFEFIKEIEGGLDLHNVFVPPLFLQPYIENSIWHGLAGKTGLKTIHLSVFIEGVNVVIQVKDNGVGVNMDVIERNRRSSKRKSFGSYATEKRIKLMYNSDRVSILTENITEHDCTGTKVSIVFPLRK
jgi:sensor histidine kinase YesM